MLVNKKLKCSKCEKEFILTAGEQSAVIMFGELKEGNHEPTTCRMCRGEEREIFDEIEVSCVKCGIKTKVLFSVEKEREVHCFNCITKS